MRIFLLLLCLVSWSPEALAKDSRKPFSYHLHREPSNLDPLQQRSLLGGYFFSHLNQPLLRYSQGKLVFESAEKCYWANKKTYVCQLRKDLKWSDGSPVTAKQFVDTFERVFSGKIKTLASEHLLSLRSAKQILRGQKKLEALGVSSKDNRRIEFVLDRVDSDFPYKIAHPAFGPTYPYKESTYPNKKDIEKLVVNGPYKVKIYRTGYYAELERNPHYWRNQKRAYPGVKIYFVEEDATALRLYESKKINFLRRVPSSLIPGYQNQNEFLQIPMARFDYIGFGPSFKNYPKLRKALVSALDYKDLKKVYRAKGTPGCPALPKAYMDKTICHEFNLKKAKKLFNEAKFDLKKPYLKFSKMGGDDIQKGMEWYQAQWKTNLGFNINLESIEQGHFLNTIRYKTPDLFRKGIPLDRPSCLAGLENFTSNHPENYIKLSDKVYDQRVLNLRKERNSKRWPQLCRRAIERLIDLAVIIPQGEIHFTMLDDKSFSGFHINEMNQMDLTDLDWAKSSL